MSKNIENDGNWLYFDYKYIGQKVDEKIFQVSFMILKRCEKIICFMNLFHFSPYHGNNLVMKI